MLNYILNRYKNFRKQYYLDTAGSYKKNYAIVGAGVHALVNLYPCIQRLQLPVKKICTLSASNADKASKIFPGCKGVTNIDDILTDQLIDAVFVCTPPKSQHEIALKILQSNKHVFVEKPPAYSEMELAALVSNEKELICQTGLQRRFSSVFEVLKKHTGNTETYNYSFLTGAYPEGDMLYELFIHPIDFAVQLFGNATLEYCAASGNKSQQTIFIVLRHADVYGSLELSTNHSWQANKDEIRLTTPSEVITARYPGYVSGIKKGQVTLGLPLEKLRKQGLTQTTYLDHSNFNPLPELNSLHLQGFFPELLHFANAVEKNKKDKFSSTGSLVNTYNILEKLKEKIA